ncbi:trypsin-like peptidase domain-containing protein [Patescibacteria group bacterium]|nr:trypsin-like peptidase domain-containing protein [Patescibacteria group bacterium]
MIVGGTFGFLVSTATFKFFRADSDPNNSGILKKLEQAAQNKFNPNQSTITDVVEKTNPAVVSIIISKDMPIIERYWGSPFGTFKDFFPSFGSGAQDPEQGQTQKQEIGGGSGFLISPDGYVVTNRHVIFDPQAEYTILTNDEKKYPARILDSDSLNDIAVLKIDPPQNSEKFPYLELGDSDQLKVGQTVIAIGNSLGEFRNTVSLGIVSGLHRNITTGGGFEQAENLSKLIQTDAAINQGNSGGPLLDINGQVIGINVAKASGADNIGFALPINPIKTIIDTIKNQGRIIRPYIGIRYILNNKNIAQQNNLPYDYGALILRGETINDLAVVPGSPADKAGLRENDLILELDGQKITDQNTPSEVIYVKKPGEQMKVKVWSQGEIKNLKIILAESGK